jgi:hypothetical protein
MARPAARSRVFTKIRRNSSPLPASLGRRDRPKATLAELGQRSRTFRTMGATVLRPGPKKPSIISSAHGPIKHMLLCYPRYGAGEYAYRSVYQDLLRKLPKRTRFTILTHPSVARDLQVVLRSAGVSKRATIVASPEYLQFLVWAEDPYVVVRDLGSKKGATYFIEPFSFTRAADAAISDLIAEATPLQNVQSPLYFQGGNVLIGDDFVLIGADYPANTLALIDDYGHIVVPAGRNAAAFVQALYRHTFDPAREVKYVGTKLPIPQEQIREFTLNGRRWTEVLYAGTGTAQPIFHIDMFISLAGRNGSGQYRVLVGSPVMADQILKRSPIEHALSEAFDDIVRGLQRLDFEVIRNPLPLTYVDDPATRTRFWYFATSNNCLVQIDRRAGNHVWLPTYGHGPWSELAKTDAENARIWRRLGFSVHMLADFHPFAQNLGSVHCIKKYVER